MNRFRLGLYDESFEIDSCGIGLIVNPTRGPSRKIVTQGLEILTNLAHRSALGADGKTSDGAGLMVQIPDEFFRSQLAQTDSVSLPPPGQYAVAQLFVPHDSTSWWEEFATRASDYDLKILALRNVPVHSSCLGPQALEIEPQVVQVFLQSLTGSDRLKQNIYQFRCWSERHFRRQSGCRDPKTGKTLSQFYVCSFSTDTIVYKGLMQPRDLDAYFPDLANPTFVSQFAMVHSRFSTNTQPAWELAQPFRLSCHNGEINTIAGNRSWMKARGAHLTEGRSDSNSFDEALELLLLSGKSVAEAMMILVPQPWESDPHLDEDVRDFYAYQALRMEPWDGPAALCFAHGITLGACLDRNGLRPCRYQVLDDGTFIAGSETGAVVIPQERIRLKGQLAAGQLVVVDLATGLIDLKNATQKNVASAQDFKKWTTQQTLRVESLKTLTPTKVEDDFCERLLNCFFWSETNSKNLVRR